jgi:hypothetical protein
MAGLVTIGPPGAARAASSGDSYNQMTGVGTTASALTVKWTQGLLDSNNQPITAPGSELSPNSDREAFAANPASATSPLSFMYADFKNLQVTVSQTQNIGHQGLTVTWKGGLPSNVSLSPESNFLQMMECYGDSSTGPSPENCEYGSFGMLGSAGAGLNNPGIGDRYGYLCRPGSVPSTDPAKTPLPIGFNDPTVGCDTYEPTSENPPHCDPQAPTGLSCKDGLFYIPFVPVDDPAHPIYEQSNLSQAFSEFNTDEVQAATTGLDETGQQQFETLTSIQAPHLGCGQLESDGKPRGCWLVIVPRGQYEPNGYKVNGSTGSGAFQQSSPLSTANWAQRIQIHLDFTPLASACPLSVAPRLVVGTEVVKRAMSSWQFALNQAAKCSRIYVYTPTEESESTQQISAGGAGLAFTTIPIGSEALRTPGQHVPTLPPMLYAPVAVTALDYGFNINEGNGYVTTPIKLTPRLLAKGLTQVYRWDLPTFDPGNERQYPGPPWAKNNPNNITLDPEFTRLNPEVVQYQLSSIPLAPLLPVDRSVLNQQVWQWIQSDHATGSWLDGTPDKSDPVAADPDYFFLHLGKAPAADSYPRAYKGVLNEGPYCVDPPQCTQKRDEILTTADMFPYAPDLDSAAASVLAASNTALTHTWLATVKYSDGTFGYWAKVGVEPLGQIFMWASSDLPDLAAYGLISAQLCAPSGSDCVQPSIDSVTKALSAATADSTGLLHINPTKVPVGGYPLVDVVYAAVPTNQSAAALNDYADLIEYAAGQGPGGGQGQTIGSHPGDLPPGYRPLPASLRAKAQAVVNQLRAIATPTPTHSATPTQSATFTQSVSPTSTGTGSNFGGGTPTSGITPGPTVGASATPTTTQAGTSGSPTGSPSPQGPTILPPSAALAGGTTQRTDVGKIRWALITVLIIGGAGALGGTVLRSGRMPRWLIRRRT